MAQRGWLKEDVEVSIEKLEAVARYGHVITHTHGGNGKKQLSNNIRTEINSSLLMITVLYITELSLSNHQSSRGTHIGKCCGRLMAVFLSFR